MATDAKRGPGRPPKPASERVGVHVGTRIPDEDAGHLEAAAEDLGTTVAECIREAIGEWLARQ